MKRIGKKNTWVQEKKHYEKEGKQEARKHRFGIRSRKRGKKSAPGPKRPSEKKKHRFGIHSRKARREENLAGTTREDDQKKPVSRSSLPGTSARNVAAEKKPRE